MRGCARERVGWCRSLKLHVLATRAKLRAEKHYSSYSHALALKRFCITPLGVCLLLTCYIM